MKIFQISNFTYKPKIIPVFKGEYDDRVRKLEDESSFFSKAYWNAESIIEKQMKQEVAELEKTLERRKIVRDAAITSLEDQKRHNSTLINGKQQELSILERQLNVDKSTLSNLKGTLSDLNSTIYEIEQANQKKNNLLKDQNCQIEDIKAKNAEIKSQQLEHEKEVQKKLERKILELEANHEVELVYLAKNINDIIKKPDTIVQEINRPKPNGFGAISGYKDEKDLIKKLFGQSVVLEKHGTVSNVPNGILLFSPDKSFNEEFATSIANQYNCRLHILDYSDGDAEKMKQLRDAASQAKTLYENSKQRTLILIKDFEEFAPPEARIVSALKSFMDTVSSSFNATILAITSHPENLNDILIRDDRFQIKLPLPLLNDTNIEKLIETELEAKTLAKTDIKKLVEKFKAFQGNGILDNKTAKSIVQNIIPKFDKETIELFSKQISLIKTM